MRANIRFGARVFHDWTPGLFGRISVRMEDLNKSKNRETKSASLGRKKRYCNDVLTDKRIHSYTSEYSTYSHDLDTK